MLPGLVQKLPRNYLILKEHLQDIRLGYTSLVSINTTSNRIDIRPTRKVYSAIVSKSLSSLASTDLIDRNENITLTVNISTIVDAN